MSKDLQKIYKVFKLIRLLKPTRPKTTKQLTNLLGSSKSQVYRYLQLLRDLGYPIQKDKQHRHFIKFEATASNNNLLEDEELMYIENLLHQTPNSAKRTNILQKINKNASLIPLADTLPGLHRTHLYQLAKTAIDLGVCIEIIGYRSMTSNNTSNRRVEPLEITEDTRYLIAWDLDKEDQRQFKFDRIQEINHLEQQVSNEHIASPMDLFGLTGKAWKDVTLELSPTAHHLLVEEFPSSRAHIRRKGKKILFRAPVRNWKGVGRFVLGLPGEIKVLGPSDFKDFLEKKIQDF